MGRGSQSYGPGGRQLYPPPGATGPVPTSQGAQPATVSTPQSFGGALQAVNSNGNGNGNGNGSGLGLPPTGPAGGRIADPIPVRMTGAGQGAQQGARGGGSRLMSGVVHVDSQYLAGWEGSGMEH